MENVGFHCIIWSFYCPGSGPGPGSGPLYFPSSVSRSPLSCNRNASAMGILMGSVRQSQGLSVGFLLSLFSRTENARWSLLPGQTFQPQPTR